MAILDSFEVTILTHDRSSTQSRGSTEPKWVEIEEYSPPGSDVQKPSYNTCRRYIGVPPLRCLDSGDRVSTEFVIDYKVRCGFIYPDQHEAGIEYIVFRTYLDGEKIGGASVSRKRWERSGTYRQRKQGRRYRVENEHQWIRQKWMFDPGLHGTIKVEIWRERTRIPIMSGWDYIDLTAEDDLVIGRQDLMETAHEPNAKRPRIRNMAKVDLLPLATFEFEYRSSETLRLLGVAEIEAETETNASNLMQSTDQVFIEEEPELWRTLTSTTSSGDTFDTMMDGFLDDPGPDGGNGKVSCGNTPVQDSLRCSLTFTDAIGRSLLTGFNETAPITDDVDPRLNLIHGNGYGDAVPKLEDNWWTECNAPMKIDEIQRYGEADLVDLTMLD